METIFHFFFVMGILLSERCIKAALTNPFGYFDFNSRTFRMLHILSERTVALSQLQILSVWAPQRPVASGKLQ